MADEYAFRITLFALAVSIYIDRKWHERRSLQLDKRQRPTALCTIVMLSWSASLAAYAFGFEPKGFGLHVPSTLRWIGAAMMVFSLPLPLWKRLYEWVGDSITTGAGWAASELADFGPHQLSLNPVYSTFFVCDLGAILLSANIGVLVTGIIAMVAMGEWVKRDYAIA